MMPKSSIYKELLAILNDYLGPVAERFLDRLIRHHLGKDPRKVTRQELPEIAGWIKVAMGLLTEDKSMVDDCEKRILKLAGS